ncbi:DinB family protein [Photobacterium sp. TY1-4]|uniref:DinB family protein n=1 Tax=Photobacterium sp. TY1-4 TaxID=2899122 RepID=UPI0021C08A6A|nr:DinB family protein [Photobacterium sp. TY1-4]UXI03039.1 DinB family protein [Photobacterium sp. TY1-4]
MMIKKSIQYKQWANTEIYEAVSRLDGKQYPEEKHLAIRLLNHIYVVDHIFQSHILGIAHGYDATNTVETPSLDNLRDNVTALDQWFVSFCDTASQESMQRVIHFEFTDGAPGTMSVEEMLNHLVLHGTYHRGAVGRILATCSIQPPADVLSRHLHLAEPQRRNERVIG